MELDKKTQKIQDKFEKKLKIVEENIELTEEEKQKVYKKLKKQIKRYQKSNIQNKKMSDLLYKLSDFLSGKDHFNNIVVGFCSTCLFMFSAIPIAAGILSNSAMMTISGGLTAAFSGTFLTNSILNYESDGTTIIQEINEIAANRYENLTSVLAELDKQLDILIKPQELEMGK